MTNTSDLQIYLDALNRFREDDLTKEILKPLFEAMGYDRVEFYGGSHERGKDLIALRRIPPKKDYHAVVVQTKKIGKSQKSSDVPVVRKLISQLSQCVTDEFPIIDGIRMRPSEVYLACPDQISSRLLDEINGQLSYLRDKQAVVMLMDGPRIIELINEFAPRLRELLLSFEDKLVFRQEDKLQNLELLTALNQRDSFDFISCYSDLSFFVGTIDSNILLSAKIAVSGKSASLDSMDWERFKKIGESISDKVGFNSISTPISQIESEFQKKLKVHLSKQNKEKLNEILESEKRASDFFGELEKAVNAARAWAARIEANAIQKEKNNFDPNEMRSIFRYLENLSKNINSNKLSHLSKFVIESLYLGDGLTIIRRLLSKDGLQPELVLLIEFMELLERDFGERKESNLVPDYNPDRREIICNSLIALKTISNSKHDKKMQRTLLEVINATESLQASFFSTAAVATTWKEDSFCLNRMVASLIFKIFNLPGMLRDLFAIANIINSIMELSEQHNRLVEGYVFMPTYRVEYDSNRLQQWLDCAAKDYRAALKKLNEKSAKVSIRTFLRKTEDTLHVIALLASNKNPLRERTVISYPDVIEHDRVDLSPHVIFDTGLNVAVYGGAGVGKTTTLQMYAKQYYSGDQLLIYLPLNRLLHKYEEFWSLQQSSHDEESVNYDLPEPKKIHTERQFDKSAVLRLILISKGLEPIQKNLNKLDFALHSRSGFKLILDGLDEAYDSISSILEAIREFRISYPNAQLIISSRDCVSYLDEIEFLGITLLPFTEGKLFKFIAGWFGGSKKADALISEIKEKGLFSTIQTPLLATIMCSLVEQGLNIPSSENAIYSKRLDLLCGEYDRHKRISRQQTAPDVLRFLAKKIAYVMHSHHERMSSMDNVISAITNSPEIPYSRELCDLAVRELINPCSVLVYDRLSETVSFGHFRFQEHLVALEMKENRNIDLIPLLALEFWRGAFVLYAQENQFFYLFDEYKRREHPISSGELTLRQMLKVRPKQERQALEELMRHSLEEESMDHLFGNADMDDEFDYHYRY